MKNFTIYLAGGMGKFGKENFDEGNKWRVLCKREFEDYDSQYYVYVDNPNDYFNFVEEPRRYQSQREIMEFDLNKVRNADLIIINFNDMYSLGSMAELAIAYERRIPVIGLDVDNKELHPWQIEMCNRIFNNIGELVDYVEDFYLNWGGELGTACYMSSHALARDLLNKPDSFITATYGNVELVIEDFKRVATHANIDDSVMHWTLNLRDGGDGNIKR